MGTEEASVILPVIVKRLNYNLAMNVLQLVYSESVIVQNIDLELDALLQSDLSTKIIWIYGYKDRYTPLHYPEELKKNYPKTHVFMSEKKEVEHAFCVKHTRCVVDQIIKICALLRLSIKPQVENYLEMEIETQQHSPSDTPLLAETTE